MTTSPWVADPNIVYVGTIEDLPRSTFAALPDHFGQRQTELHAVTLIGSGVLDHPLDQHREVSTILVGDPNSGITIEQMVAAYHADPNAALIQWGCKENGHTRNWIWSLGNGNAAPDTLRTTVYAAVDREAAMQSYNAVDSLTAAKVRKDVMQSTLRIAGIQPTSPWLQRASNLGGALDLAVAVLCGGRNHPARQQRAVMLRSANTDAFEQRMHGLLPHLIAVQRFKAAIETFDDLTPSAALMPMSQSAFVAAYLSILYRDHEDGRTFLQSLQTQPGEYAGGLMDAFYAVKKIDEYVHRADRAQKSTAGQRTEQILACVLASYDGWLNDKTFKADSFPTRASAITRFNPILRKAADEFGAAEKAAKIKAKERKLEERRRPSGEGRLMRRRSQQPSFLPPSLDGDRPSA